MGERTERRQKGALIKNVRVFEEDEVLNEDCDTKNALLRAMVTISTGKVFYVDPVSRADIADAINIAVEVGQTTTIWKLAEPINGTKFSNVSLSEMREARLLGLQLKGSLVGA